MALFVVHCDVFKDNFIMDFRAYTHKNFWHVTRFHLLYYQHFPLFFNLEDFLDVFRDDNLQ